ncbi:hypothetical protein NQZ68_019395, partial [Dissostichus eleginoides]
LVFGWQTGDMLRHVSVLKLAFGREPLLNRCLTVIEMDRREGRKEGETWGERERAMGYKRGGEEQSQPQKATPPSPVNGGKEKENVSPPSEGKKTTDSITGAKTLLSRMMRVAQRYLLDPMARQKAEEKTSTLGRVFKGRISASLTQAQMRAKMQSQHRGRAQQAGVQGAVVMSLWPLSL